MKNLDLLNSHITDHAYNSQDVFINFYSMKKEVCTAIKKRIISYGQKDIIKKFTYTNIIFTNVLYIPILVNNLYYVSCLCYCV